MNTYSPVCVFSSLCTYNKEVSTLSTCTDAEIKERITQFGTQAYVAKSDEDVFKSSTSFESSHHQAKHPSSNTALLVGFLMLWLKHCVIPSTPQEVLFVSVVYHIILLAYNHPLGLLPAMVCNILSGLITLTTRSLKVEKIMDKKVNDKYITPTQKSNFDILI